ncbi:MAG TPA: hypothetical protein VLD39_11415 [Gammaproteobacteria bacterium]|nr:hypothetical protein [Gammaproteobacteria bacterium]
MRASSAGDRVFSIGAICVCLAAVSASRIAAAAGEPDLSGNWIIDEAHSDEPHEVLDSAMRRSSGGLGRVRAGVSIFGIPVDDVVDLAKDGDSSNQSEEQSREDLHRHVSDAIDALVIVQDADSMRVDYDGIHAFLYRNGATMSDGDATIHADWRRGAYFVEREAPGRAKVVEEFRLERGDQLYWSVSTELESGKNVRIRRVYDRADSR